MKHAIVGLGFHSTIIMYSFISVEEKLLQRYIHTTVAMTTCINSVNTYFPMFSGRACNEISLIERHVKFRSSGKLSGSLQQNKKNKTRINNCTRIRWLETLCEIFIMSTTSTTTLKRTSLIASSMYLVSRKNILNYLV